VFDCFVVVLVVVTTELDFHYVGYATSVRLCMTIGKYHQVESEIEIMLVRKKEDLN